MLGRLDLGLRLMSDLEVRWIQTRWLIRNAGTRLDCSEIRPCLAVKPDFVDDWAFSSLDEDLNEERRVAEGGLAIGPACTQWLLRDRSTAHSGLVDDEVRQAVSHRAATYRRSGNPCSTLKTPAHSCVHILAVLVEADWPREVGNDDPRFESDKRQRVFYPKASSVLQAQTAPGQTCINSISKRPFPRKSNRTILSPLLFTPEFKQLHSWACRGW